MYFTIFFVLVFVALQKNSFALNNITGCVTTFFKDKSNFEECKTKLCFIFLHEQPFVYRNEKLEKEEPKPFPCRSRHYLYPGLRGLFFDVLDAIGKYDSHIGKDIRDALCIYAGSTCTFDNEIRFIENSTAENTSYNFIAGGFLLFLPYRRTKNTITSSHIFIDNLVLIYRRDPEVGSWKESVKNILSPFQWRAWIVIVASISVLFLCACLFLYRFAPPGNCLKWTVTPQLENNVPADERIAWISLKWAIAVLFTVLLLLYEISVALWIFRGPPPMVEDLQQLPGLGLDRYAVVANGASEAIFRNIVDKENKYLGNDALWTRGDRLNGILKLLLDKSSKVDYVFNFRSNVKNELHESNLCSKVIWDPLPKEEIGGWYYSSSLPEATRARLDSALSSLWFDSENQFILKKYEEDSVKCPKMRNQVSYKTMLMVLGVWMVPFLLVFTVSIFSPCVGFCRRIRHESQRRIQEQQTSSTHDRSRTSSTQVDGRKE